MKINGLLLSILTFILTASSLQATKTIGNKTFFSFIPKTPHDIVLQSITKVDFPSPNFVEQVAMNDIIDINNDLTARGINTYAMNDVIIYNVPVIKQISNTCGYNALYNVSVALSTIELFDPLKPEDFVMQFVQKINNDRMIFLKNMRPLFLANSLSAARRDFDNLEDQVLDLDTMEICNLVKVMQGMNTPQNDLGDIFLLAWINDFNKDTMQSEALSPQEMSMQRERMNLKAIAEHNPNELCIETMQIAQKNKSVKFLHSSVNLSKEIMLKALEHNRIGDYSFAPFIVHLGYYHWISLLVFVQPETRDIIIYSFNSLPESIMNNIYYQEQINYIVKTIKEVI